MVRVSRNRERILDYVRAFLQERGYAPTVRDIVKGCKISTSSVVQYHLNILENEGYIQRDPQVFRSIRLVNQENSPFTRVPLLGTIAAGEPLPVPAPDTWSMAADEMVALTEEIKQGKKDIYALRVKGTSMIDALIDDGDIVLMQYVNTVDDGDMAAVWLKRQQEVTLKKVYKEQGRVRLQPANRQMKPIYQEADNVEIQGRVIGVIRSI